MSDIFSDMVAGYEDDEDILQNPTAYMSLAKAARHEDTERHAQRIQDWKLPRHNKLGRTCDGDISFVSSSAVFSS
ncbi:hypothetical protein EIP86_003370 [Pleurotus ostreatoroseus]|nr:hypothetical protein EIP86_003370 [Pleurotus ostreatoroseus]